MFPVYRIQKEASGSPPGGLVLDRGVTRIAFRQSAGLRPLSAAALTRRLLGSPPDFLASRRRPSGSTPSIYMSTNNKNDTSWVSSCYWYSIGESNGAPSPRNRTERRVWSHHLLNVTSYVTRFTPDVLMLRKPALMRIAWTTTLFLFLG